MDTRAGVVLVRQVKVDGKWQRLPVLRTVERGEIRHDLARVTLRGVPMIVKEGTFFLEYREDGRKVRRAVDRIDVKAAFATQVSVMALRAKGVATDDAPQLRPRPAGRPEGKTIREVIDGFVKAPPLEYRRKTYLKYRNALESYRTWTRKRYVEEVDRDEVKAFMSGQVQAYGLDVSTAVDKGHVLVKIFRDQGAPIAMRRGDWPKVTERQPDIYQAETLKKLFAAANPDEYVLFQTFLLTGMREQEVSYLHWTDFNAKRSTLRVSKKAGFDPKNYDERTVPIPQLLVELLEAHRTRQSEAMPVDARGRKMPDELLIFPTSRHNVEQGRPGGQADGHLLRRLKGLAFRAGLNCGRCRRRVKGELTSCTAAAVCGEFGLHKFRHTYATTILRDGVDLVSVQKLLGHHDLASTRRYLRGLEPDDLLAKINLTSIATRFV